MFSELHREHLSVYRHIPCMRAPISTLGPRLAVRAAVPAGRCKRPGRPLEQSKQLLGDEAGPRCIEVTIALRMRALDEETLGHDQMEVVLCAGRKPGLSSPMRVPR